MIKLTDLHPRPDNPRKISPENLEKLKASIEKFKKMMTVNQIVVDEQGRILRGNQRYAALVSLGYNEIPNAWVKKIKGWTEKEMNDFTVIDNSHYGEWDLDIILDDDTIWDYAELKEDLDIDLPDVEIDGEIEETAGEDSYQPKDDLAIHVQPGDLITIGRHRLLCGDSGDSEDVSRLMEGEQADLCFTDPPYGVTYLGHGTPREGIENDDLTEKDLEENIIAWFDGIDQAIRPGAYVLMTVPPGPLILCFLQDFKRRDWLRQILIWAKDSMVMGRSEYHYKHEAILFGWKPGKRLKNKDRTKTSIWEFDRPKISREHPTMKPVLMWEYGIQQHTRPGALVYEPFAGSGTSFVACQQTNRTCYGLETDPKYCQVIIDRLTTLDPSLDVTINGEHYDPQQ